MKDKKKLLKEILEWTATILGAVFIAICIRSYAFAQTEVRQCSMQNTLFEGQRVIELKIGYYFTTPKRGDIVIINRKAEKGLVMSFISNAKDLLDKITNREINVDDKRLIKRVIGLPGDTLDIRDGKVYINGKVLEEDYVKGITFPNDGSFPIEIPKKMYFVMGDNRENSMDSRDLGLFSMDQIEGKAIFRVWPVNKIGTIDR